MRGPRDFKKLHGQSASLKQELADMACLRDKDYLFFLGYV